MVPGFVKSTTCCGRAGEIALSAFAREPAGTRVAGAARNGTLEPGLQYPKSGAFMLVLILLVFAFVLFCVAAWLTPSHPWSGRIGLIGLACWSLAEIVSRVPGLPVR